ncbi:MAG TPA: AAA family ATPase [Candidatus Lokiarchaeia archaeon]|nr:AAA family ATPase [Candidatus Lokiarchaeia archaeon]
MDSRVIMFHVIGLVGMPGAGKSTCIEHLQSGGAKIINMGDMVREQVTLAGLPITHENLGKMAEALREQRGHDVVAQLTAEKVAKIAEDGDLVIIDGLRSMHEVEFFRTQWQFPIVAVHSSPETRYARLRERNREDDSPEPGYYEYRDARELKFGIAEVIAMADEMIVNTSNTSEQELQDQASAAIDRLLNKVEEA